MLHEASGCIASIDIQQTGAKMSGKTVRQVAIAERQVVTHGLHVVFVEEGVRPDCAVEVLALGQYLDDLVEELFVF